MRAFTLEGQLLILSKLNTNALTFNIFALNIYFLRLICELPLLFFILKVNFTIHEDVNFFAV